MPKFDVSCVDDSCHTSWQIEERVGGSCKCPKCGKPRWLRADDIITETPKGKFKRPKVKDPISEPLRGFNPEIDKPTWRPFKSPYVVKSAMIVGVLLILFVIAMRMPNAPAEPSRSSEVILANNPIPKIEAVPEYVPIHIEPITPVTKSPSADLKPIDTSRLKKNEPTQEPELSVDDILGKYQAPEPGKPRNTYRGETEILDQNEETGRCSITIKNDASEDAIVKLRDTITDRKFATCYIKHGDSVKIPQVPDGSYQVFALFGSGYLPLKISFEYKSSALKDDDVSELATTTIGNELHWTNLTVTIFETPGISNQKFSIEDFDKI